MTLPPMPPPNTPYEEFVRMTTLRREEKKRILENSAGVAGPYVGDDLSWCDLPGYYQDGQGCYREDLDYPIGFLCDKASWFDYMENVPCFYDGPSGTGYDGYEGPCVNADGKIIELHPCASTGMFFANKNYGIFEGSMGVVAEETDRAVRDGKVKFLQAMGDVYVQAGAVAGAMIATRLAFINAMGDAQREATSFPVNFPPIVPLPPLP